MPPGPERRMCRLCGLPKWDAVAMPSAIGVRTNDGARSDCGRRLAGRVPPGAGGDPWGLQHESRRQERPGDQSPVVSGLREVCGQPLDQVGGASGLEPYASWAGEVGDEPFAAEDCRLPTAGLADRVLHRGVEGPPGPGVTGRRLPP